MVSAMVGPMRVANISPMIGQYSSSTGIWETTPSSSLSSNKNISSSNSVEVSVNNIIDSIFGYINESELNLIRNNECNNSPANNFNGASFKALEP
ncbi:hypothetical protein PV325_006913 [Microctonus aethiopoides]|nr:hypothetical protein PV325_006913 [Microctonus aethiopoides]